MSSKGANHRIMIAALSASILLSSLLNVSVARADTVVEVSVTGTVQVVAVDGPDGPSTIASVAVGGISVPISDPAQAGTLYSGDQVSFIVDVPSTVIDSLSPEDQATLASQPIANGVVQVAGDTDLGASLLQQTLATTSTPQINGLTVTRSPATAPLAPPGTGQPIEGPVIGGTAITPAVLNQTINLAIAFAGSDANPWLTDAGAMDYIAQVQAWYRQYTGMNFVFTVPTLVHLTNASATICGDTSAAVTEMNRAATLFGQTSTSSYTYPTMNRVHLVVLEDMTAAACSGATFAGLGTVSYPGTTVPGYNTGGALMVRVSQNPGINGGPLYSIRSIAHELGHNFGFNHSNSLMCSALNGVGSWNQSMAGNCLNLEYGDMFDIMGHHQNPGAMGATRKYQSGLLESSAIITIDTLVTSQTVTLTMLPTGDDTSPQLIYIDDLVPAAGSRDPSIVADLPYLVELRRPTNMDGTTSASLGGPGFVVLRANRTQTWMLQPTVPGLNSSNLSYTFNREMGAGDTFTSTDGMIGLRVVSVPAASCTANCVGTISVTRNNTPTPPATSTTMYRIYDPTTGEHFYTSSAREAWANIISGEWSYEGAGWYAPLSGTPVYRLAANPGTGSVGHLFTTSTKERDAALASTNPYGQSYWHCETGAGMPNCVGWYSGGTTPVYRSFYPGTGEHNYTTDANEQRVITGNGPMGGWNDEGVGWYGVQGGNPWVTLP